MTDNMEAVFDALREAQALKGEHSVSVAFIHPDEDAPPGGYLIVNGFIGGKPAFSFTVLNAMLNAVATPKDKAA